MFGVIFPANFNSPYKALSVIDFWRRWHMTLSRFLRDYLYIPLGGGRGSALLRYRNLFATMLLGGLWHGAGWTYVLWGAMHGLLLIANHLWREAIAVRLLNLPAAIRAPGRIAAGTLTFLCVVLAWVLFRADSLQAARVMYAGMAGVNGVWTTMTYYKLGPELAMLLACAAIVWLLPNVQELLAVHRPVLDVYPVLSGAKQRFKWQARARWALLSSVVFVVSLINMSKISEFLYFQF
jgi:D-alanyl-lipoteichoic acid acyltransferase DltB (MBOAT superfamily)